jgi:hypothetical protein
LYVSPVLSLCVAAAFLATSTPSRAGTILSESFDSISTLSGNGWVLTNESSSIGLTKGWYQGAQNVFPSQAGPANGYVASNYNAAGSPGTLANWLITPVFSTAAAGTVTFYVQAAAEPGYEDHISYGFSDGSSLTADFTNMTAPILLSGGWQEFTVAFAAQGIGSTARFAIEYVGDADLSNYIGVDTLSIQTDETAAVPEPATWAMMLLGFSGLGAALRSRSRHKVVAT